jgi:hypothetical protein
VRWQNAIKSKGCGWFTLAWTINVKILLVSLLGLVVVSLFSSLFFVYKDKGNSKRAVNALTVRIALSILIILIVIASYLLGALPPK